MRKKPSFEQYLRQRLGKVNGEVVYASDRIAYDEFMQQFEKKRKVLKK